MRSRLVIWMSVPNIVHACAYLFSCANGQFDLTYWKTPMLSIALTLSVVHSVSQDSPIESHRSKSIKWQTIHSLERNPQCNPVRNVVVDAAAISSIYLRLLLDDTAYDALFGYCCCHCCSCVLSQFKSFHCLFCLPKCLSALQGHANGSISLS